MAENQIPAANENINKFSAIDIKNYYEDRLRNYFIEYDPKFFWEDFGQYYLNTFCKETFLLNLKFLTSRLNQIKPESVLEVGAGFGRCLGTIIANKLAKRVIGIELSGSMITSSKDFFAIVKDVLPEERPTIIQADAQHIPFADKSFDCVFTHVCLTHIPPEKVGKVREEISRVAKKAIIHIERFTFPYEHGYTHIWSHQHIPHYEQLGWNVHEYCEIHSEHKTKLLVLFKNCKKTC